MPAYVMFGRCSRLSAPPVVSGLAPKNRQQNVQRRRWTRGTISLTASHINGVVLRHHSVSVDVTVPVAFSAMGQVYIAHAVYTVARNA